ncbi:DUF6615 family protein [Psychrobacter immobilis]|uniref:DUF6615 family protein n=1 Tax=Psychrobacter immobilis TaxID=498 RepID=UPI001918CFB8|nr:DUF6615 family protein [Psychrobacter immobilis]
MNMCEKHKEVERQVVEFTENVRHVGEESITDYLFWKWADINKCFQHLDFSHYTKHQESKTSGADFRMEIWLVGKTQSLPLLFQAKKISKEYQNYIAAINYPKKTKNQIDTLLGYAKTKRKVPLYMFYSDSGFKQHKSFRGGVHKVPGIYIAHAKTVKKIANQKPGFKLSRTQLLSKSMSFHNLFCFTQEDLDQNNSDIIGLIIERLSALVDSSEEVSNCVVSSELLPGYVTQLLSETVATKEEDYKDAEKTHIRNRESLKAYIASIGVREDNVFYDNYGNSNNHSLMSTNIAVYDLRI